MIEAIKVGQTTSAHFTNVSSKKRNDLIQEQNSTISENYSNAISNQTKALINIENQISPSFKGTQIYEFPSTDDRPVPEIFTNNYSAPIGASSDNLRNYIQQNPGNFLVVKDTELKINGMYGYPEGKFVRDAGVSYIENDGTLTYFSNKDIENFASGQKASEISLRDKVFLGLLSKGRKNEAIIFSEQYNSTNKLIQQFLVDLCVESGRDDEALQRFPSYENQINNAVNRYKKVFTPDTEPTKLQISLELIADKKIKEAIKQGVENLPYPLSDYSEKELNFALHFLQGEESLEEWAKKELERAENTVVTHPTDKNPKGRMAIGVLTLGFSELKRLAEVGLNKQELVSRTEEKVARTRQCVSDILTTIHNAPQSLAKINAAKQKEVQAIEKEKEPIKKELSTKFVTPFKKGLNIPSFVMLTGSNPYAMEEFAQWSAKETGANFSTVNASYSKTMRENLQQQLERAEAHYRKTGEHSVIFVNGMEKLLDSAINKTEDIYTIKNAMYNAMSDYHSTIIFYAQDKGIIRDINTKNGVAINVPIATK